MLVSPLSGTTDIIFMEIPGALLKKESVRLFRNCQNLKLPRVTFFFFFLIIAVRDRNDEGIACRK